MGHTVSKGFTQIISLSQLTKEVDVIIILIFTDEETDTERLSPKPMSLVPNYTLPTLLLQLSTDLLPLNL